MRLGGLSWLALLVPIALAAGAAGVELRPVPHPDLEPLEPEVAEQIAALRRELEPALETGEAAERAAAYGELGRLYHAYGLADAAQACYANAETLDPDEPRWPHLAAYLFQAAGRFEEASAAFRRALDLDPTDFPARVRLAESELAAGRTEEAGALLGEALAERPGSPAARALLGEVALAGRRYREAVELIEPVLATTPEATRLHYPLALAYRGLGEMDEARRHLELRGDVGVRPPDPWFDELQELKTGERVHLLRGRKAFQAGDFAAAAEAFRRAVESRPESARARVNLGSALGQLGDREGAVAEYRTALAIEPGNATARFNLGVLLLAAGEPAEAAEHLAAAVETAPDDPQTRLQLAAALARTGRAEEALPHLRQAVELDPASESARLAEAELLAALGRFQEARQRLEEAHAALPAAGLIAHAVARLLAACPDTALRDGPRAVELAEKVFAAQQTVEYAETLALALAEAGRCAEAAEWQRQAAEAARRLGRAELAAKLEGVLPRYQAGPPCRP